MFLDQPVLKLKTTTGTSQSRKFIVKNFQLSHGKCEQRKRFTLFLFFLGAKGTFPCGNASCLNLAVPFVPLKGGNVSNAGRDCSLGADTQIHFLCISDPKACLVHSAALFILAFPAISTCPGCPLSSSNTALKMDLLSKISRSRGKRHRSQCTHQQVDQSPKHKYLGSLSLKDN